MHLSALTLLATSLLTIPTLQFPNYSRSSTPETIYQFSNPTWIENIASLRNGSLLVSIIDRPELQLVHPSTNQPSATLIHSFTCSTSVLGITELAPDVFAVISGNYTTTGGSVPGTYSVWNVDLNGPTAKVEKIAGVPEGQLLNGIAALNEHTLLIADSNAGNVILLDTTTGKSEVVLDHESMKPVPGAPIPIGINGLKIHDGYLYYTNSFQETLSRVKVDRKTGTAVGAFETVATNLPLADDFDVAKDGTAFVTQNYGNVVNRVGVDGKVEVIAGNLNSSVVAGPTGAVLGKTWRDMDVLYVSTTGGLGSPVNGTFTEGGKVVAVRVE
ncbi:hypothetical protein K469DRAFT_582736 [Zopfia rhizophila CBS 207.26]|uniref:SMP-30/Gluconolactonase/LRE-like region domain-containing protein n=1 Tax=Zopfia rhizophila CBS 207.26 TaxID=1314779 RepID=A0A6A6DWQ9_9PEZI|nr:hypothetical protein K469DRAFT_582736 [Zopfia rhizophila CBS 207.26]